MPDPWKPNVTVAAIAERGGRFLMVEEETVGGRMFNQPAGHLDPGESLLDAVIRETLEETAHHFRPSALIGIYRQPAGEGVTYLRFAFAGDITSDEPARALDHGIVRALWMTPDEIHACRDRHRTPLLARCLDDYRAGRRYPLDLLSEPKSLLWA
ncbi:MAG: NUDIX hydrolase [Burkholderiales bacterium]